jgi:hypothetical protein
MLSSTTTAQVIPSFQLVLLSMFEQHSLLSCGVCASTHVMKLHDLHQVKGKRHPVEVLCVERANIVTPSLSRSTAMIPKGTGGMTLLPALSWDTQMLHAHESWQPPAEAAAQSPRELVQGPPSHPARHSFT